MHDVHPPRRHRHAVILAWLGLTVVTSALVWQSTVASYLLRSAFPVLIAVLLVRSTRRGGGLGRHRLWFAAALVVGAVAGVASALSVVLLGAETGPGSLVDWIGLSYVPFAVVAVLSLPREKGSPYSVTANAVVAAGSLWFLVLAVTHRLDGDHAALRGAASITSLGYVLVPTFVLALLLSVLPRVRGLEARFLAPLAVGMVLMTIADGSYGIMTLLGYPYDSSSWLTATAQVALCCYLACALTPSRTQRPRRAASHRPAGVAETVVPYAPLGLTLLASLETFAQGGTLTNQQIPPLLVIGTGILVRHLAATADHERLTADLVASAKEADEESLRDPLTRLANRKAFLAHLTDVLVQPHQRPVAVALLDLNDFKDVNDSHGHGTGDLLLREVACRLTEAVPPGGMVARLGGDEFVVSQPAVRDGAAALAAAVAAAFEEPIVVGSRRFLTRPSIGVVLDEQGRPGGQRGLDGDGDGDRDGTAAAEYLLAHADVAMYEAKADKTLVNAPVVVLTGQARERAAGMIRLREEINAPDLSQFRVVYQGVVDLRDERVVGVEALLRWSHPELGEVSPAQFIPMAEQVGSIGVLGEFVLATAIEDLARMQAVAGDRRIGVNVNLSPAQLADDTLPDRLLGMLAGRSLAADQLVLEITEGALVRDLEAAADMVTRLRRCGMSVAVDDFGTGYSSLGYLRRFPVDELKIDREFVSVLPGDARTAVLLRSVVEMATALGIVTVAEGIETPEQAQAMREMGCTLGQGYLFSRPVPLAALLRSLAREQAAEVLPVQLRSQPVSVPTRIG